MKAEAIEVRDASPGYVAQVEMPVVPEGYKQTDVGVIPEDWLALTLAGLSPFVTSGSRGWAAYYSKFGDLFLRITNMCRESVNLDLRDSRFVSVPEASQEGSRTSLKYGDVLVSITADIGIISYVDESVPLPAYINQHIALVRLPADVVCSKFVALFLAFGQGQKRFRAITDQGAKAGINLKTVKEIPLALPTALGEQRAIATALSDVDALLEALDRLIAKKRDIKQATMQQLLTGQTRLPGDWLVKDGYKQTEVGVIPEDWEECSLGEQVDILTGFPFPSDTYSSSGVRLLRGSNVKRGILDWSADIARFWPEVATKLRQYELKEGDLVIAMDGALVGRSYASLGKDDLPALLVQRVARLRSDRVDQDLLKGWISSEQFIHHVDLRKTHTAIPHISPKDIREFKVAIPTDSNEQRAIATVLSEMDTELEALQQRRTKTAALKQAMMQDLLTGRTRLV